MPEHPRADFTAGIFDHYNPEDFGNVGTSAVDEAVRHNHGQRAFDDFVAEMLRAVRLAFTASEGQINPVAVLVSADRQRTFTPNDDETMGQYVDRLHTEADDMDAQWAFIVRKTMVGTVSVVPEEDGGLHDVTDEKMISAAEQQGMMREGVLWFAERRDGTRQRRHGIMEALTDNRLNQGMEAPAGQPMPIFERILAN